MLQVHLSKEFQMFSLNVGTIDRVLRIALGGAGLAFFAMNKTPLHWWGLVGVVPLLTGMLGRCPMYSVLGVSTCASKPKGR